MRKSIIILLSLVLILISGCSERITLDNIENHLNEVDYQYSKVTIGNNIKEMEETQIIKEAKEFANRFMAVKYTRSYDGIEKKEDVLYSEHFKEKYKNYEEISSFDSEFYKKYKLSTELQTVDFDKVVYIGDDAYVHLVATIRLLNCGSKEFASILGFNDGVYTNIRCEYDLKMEYTDGEYFIYDYKLIEREGQLKSFEEYEEELTKIAELINQNEPDDEEANENDYEITDSEMRIFIDKLCRTQNNRNYETFKGNEDYVYMSKSYIEELNKYRNDASYSSSIYKKLKLSTEYIRAEVKQIVKNGNKYNVFVDVESKITSCISDEQAAKIGYPGGIGSSTIMRGEFVVGRENNEIKLFDVISLK